MTKPKKYRPELMAIVPEPVDLQVAETSQDDAPKPRVTSFVPRPCYCCTALREPDSSYSRVTSTQGNIRYCKCGFCGNTWKEQG